MNKNSMADTLFMFVASRGSTWVATVRVSTGFQPNKMLHSTWEGGSGVRLYVCVRTGMEEAGQEVRLKA